MLYVMSYSKGGDGVGKYALEVWILPVPLFIVLSRGPDLYLSILSRQETHVDVYTRRRMKDGHKVPNMPSEYRSSPHCIFPLFCCIGKLTDTGQTGILYNDLPGPAGKVGVTEKL